MQRTNTQDNIYKKAIAELTEKIDHSWLITWAEDYWLRGKYYLLSHQYDNALADAHKAVDAAITKTNKFRAHALRGAVYFAKDQYQQAIEDLNFAFNKEECWTQDCKVSNLEAGHAAFALARAYEAIHNIGATIAWFLTAAALNATYLNEVKTLLRTAFSAIRLETDLSDANKDDIFYAIKIAFSQNEQIPLLLQCLDKKTALGKRMWAQEKGLFSTIDPNIETGILKEICDYLIRIDIAYSVTIKSIVASNEEPPAAEPVSTSSVIKETIINVAKTIDNSLKSSFTTYLEKSELHLANGNYEEALADAKKAYESAYIEPSFFNAHFQGGKISSLLNEDREAILYFKLALGFLGLGINSVEETKIKEIVAITRRILQKGEETTLIVNLYIQMISIEGLYPKFIEETDILTALQSNTDFSQLPQNGIFNLIKTLPAEHQTSLFLLCLDKETPLGKRMWEKEDPKDWREPSIERGTLKNICDALMVIDPCFSTLINKYAARMPTTSTTTFTKKTPENKKSPENKTDAYFGL